MKFFNNIDLNKNQIINVVLHSTGTAPTSPVNGQIYHNSTENVIYYYNSTTSTWIPIGTGSVTAVNGGNGLTSSVTGSVVTLDVNVDGATLEIVGDQVRIKDLGVTTAKLANSAVTTAKITDGNVTTIKIADQAITFAKIQNIPTMTVIGRTAAGAGVPSSIAILDEDDMISDSPVALATQQSIKAYVDATVASLGSLQGSINATTATTFPGGPAVTKGDYWYVAVAGTIAGVALNVGDVLIANKDNPSTTAPGDWIFLETNRDQASTTVLGLVTLATAAEVNTGTDATKVVTPATLNQRTATETRTGLIEIATQAETDTGTDDARAITPLKLKTYLTTYVGGYAANIGNGSLTNFTITHSLNSLDLVWNLVEVATGQSVMADIAFPTVNTATVTFAGIVPSTNQFRLILKK